MKLKKLLDKIPKTVGVVLLDDSYETFAVVVKDNGSDSGYALRFVESRTHTPKENINRAPAPIVDCKVEYIFPLDLETLVVAVSW